VAVEEEIAVGVDEMPVDCFDLLPGMTLMSSICTLPWTLMSRLQLKSLMRSCTLASRQLEMLTRMVRGAARPDEERQTITGSNRHRTRCPMHCCVWIQNVRTWRWLTMTHTNDYMEEQEIATDIL